MDYAHLGIFSDWVAAARTQQPLFPIAPPGPDTQARLREVLGSHPGMIEVHLRVLNGERTHSVRLGEELRVTRSPALVGDVKALLGTEGFVQ